LKEPVPPPERGGRMDEERAGWEMGEEGLTRIEV